MKRRSLVWRLTKLYSFLLGVTVLLVIAASAIALIYERHGFSTDIVVAKHEEARFLAERMQDDGMTLKEAAPRIVSAISGIGMHVAIYDPKGTFLAGDPSVRPRLLNEVLNGNVRLPAPRSPSDELRPQPLPSGAPPPQARREWLSVAAIRGGYATFQSSDWIIASNLIPYWWIVFGIAIVAVVGSLFIGIYFAREAIAPVNEVTASLEALAGGDYTQRRFVTARGDEIATLTQAYNEAAASVASAMEERKSVESRMRQFVADAGHELRTPLTVIAGYIDVLRRGAIEEPKVAKQILGTMALEKEHMRTLIDRLMRLARMDSDAPPRPGPIDVTAFLRDQAEAARRMDDQREIDYQVDGAREIIADKTELGEAVWNVVENALKYAPGAPIHLRAYRSDGSTVLSIHDEGPGMSEFERMHAFERFYRGEARGEIPGTGLGLSIAKRATERAGGEISIDSGPGRGTTVLMSFKSVSS